jgi:chaperonin cofactor prefoldin
LSYFDICQIHEKLVQESTWNNKLDKLNWRIDSKAKSKKEAELNELTAIMEFHLSNHQNPQNVTSKVVRFEMDQTQLNSALSQIKSIQQQLSKFTS